ncbi:cytochrome b [Burkholderia vietnamiensis]|uniref:cytochrome b n=1 Tax=Burkholderia vietnamiensis TaxID=60552 RepID=UPI00075BBE71|nr:cytochrome b/b6 domain-containing protein [Burkholderia vietnamiensis]KVF80704.1 cytochrome B [Burkholderia vietnamiensis]KVF82030.1 cytochrome B [Burkholderia vietnamiensis]KVF87133.1 cytochrome B [Burkholderia vietnamiensis]KVF96048.1 cytochrome B [Burkholderia vietnamiensis]MCA8232196.1 cytochrome b/b6 domain-containing protein [Burkholderia vietnamiensis]
MKTATRYPLSISLLHWLLAVALTGNLIVGLLLDDNEDLVGLHKSIGVAILLLVALRLVNRLRARDRLPPSVNPAGTLRHSAERAVHGLLYALMLAIPVLGWLKTNAAGHPASCFGLFSLPTLVAKNRELSHWLGELHALAAYALVALVGLHVAAAVAHRVVHAENVLPRILPWSARSGRRGLQAKDIG